MAAVVGRNNWCKLLLAMFLFASLSFSAGFVNRDPTTQSTYMDVSVKDGNITAVLVSENLRADVAHTREVLEAAYKKAQVGDQGGSQGLVSSRLDEYLRNVDVEIKRIAGAEVYFYYYKHERIGGQYEYTRVDIPGCSPAITNHEGVAECKLRPEDYEGTCRDVYVSFGDPVYGAQYEVNYQPAMETVIVCDKNTPSLVLMGSVMESELAKADPLICFVSILMGGMLLASMFFAGRSPLSLLDLTTPLLPKAKTISYSGLTMGVGFARLGREMARQTEHLNRSSAATLSDLESKLSRMLLDRNLPKRFDRGALARLLNVIKTSRASSVIKMMALRALIAGKSEEFVRKILDLRLLAGDKDAYRAEFGRILSELNRLPDSAYLNREEKHIHDRVIDVSKMTILNEMQREAFGGATGSVWKSLTKPRFLIQDYLPMAGMHVTGAVASVFFATRYAARLYRQTFLRTPLRVLDRKGKIAKKVQMVVDDRKGKYGRGTKWLATQLAPEPHERNVVRLYNVFEKGEADYKRLMLESKRDMMHWLIGRMASQIFRKVGGGKMDLSREEVLEIGDKGPEELMFGSSERMKRFMVLFMPIEKDLRSILSNRNFTEFQKIEAIMALMKARGLAIPDEARVLKALAVLREIETDRPKNFHDADYGDKRSEESVLNSHRYFRLRRFLEDFSGVDRLMDLSHMDSEGKFYFTVGRNELAYGKSDHTFGTFLRSKYREALESQIPPGAKPVTFSDVANYAFLRIVNERWGIIDPYNPGLTDRVKQIMLRAQSWLSSLANAAAFKGDGLDPGNMAHLMGQFYGPAARGKGDLMAIGGHGTEHGPREGMWRMDMKAHWRTIGGPMVSGKSTVEHQAHGEVYYSHRVPLAIQKMLEKAREHGYRLTPEDARSKYRDDVVVPSILFTRLKSIMEMDNPNTYFTSQGEFTRFREMLASYRARIAEGIKEDGKSINPLRITDKQVLDYIRTPLTISDISKNTWLRLREGQYAPFVKEHTYGLGQADRVVNAKYYIKNDGRWEVFSPHKLYRDRPMREVFLGAEKTYLAHAEIKGVGAADRLRYVRIMDPLKALAKAYDPNATADPAYKDALARLDMKEINSFLTHLGNLARSNPKRADSYAAMAAQMFSSYGRHLENVGMDLDALLGHFDGTRARDRISLEVNMSRYEHGDRSAAGWLKDWADDGARGENRKAKVALLFYHHAQSSGNWDDFNNYGEAVKLMPGGMPLPEDMRGRDKYEASGGIGGWVKTKLASISDFASPYFRNLNVGYENYLMGLFGKETRAQYEGSMISEYFRATGAQFAGKLAAGEFGNVRDERNNPSMKAYNALMDSFVKYHSVWDETITRDPRGNSSAIGNGFIYSSFFHMGPATAYGSGPYQRATFGGFNKPRYSLSNIVAGFRGLQWAPQVFNWAIGSPFLIAYRTYITSRWGMFSKYDRAYKDSIGSGGMGGEWGEEERQEASLAEERERQEREKKSSVMGAGERYSDYHLRETQRYEEQMRAYDKELNRRSTELQTAGIAQDEALRQARDELYRFMPKAPAFELQRDTLSPFHSTAPRALDAWRSMFSVGQYSGMDAGVTTLGKMLRVAATSPLSPLNFIPYQPFQSWLMDKGTSIMHRPDSDVSPYYVQPPKWRRRFMAGRSHMAYTEYGGSDIHRGVTRTPEDTWMYQSGVNSIWANANPGVSYVDFSMTHHIDPRAANWLRYESKFRPFMEYDEYLERQSHLGLVKRDIDPFRLLMARNEEISHYGLKHNSLFRFLNIGLYGYYKGRSMMERLGERMYHLNNFVRGNTTGVCTERGGSIISGTMTAGAMGVERFTNNFKRKVIALKSHIRFCACGSPLAAGGECPACSNKVRCIHCQSIVNPSHNHTCNHGLQRNISMDRFAGDKNTRDEIKRWRSWRLSA